MIQKAAGTVLLLIGLSGCQLNTKTPAPLLENSPVEAKTSSISVPIVIPSNEIKNILQRSINESLTDGYLLKASGISIGPGVDLQFILRPNGPVSASASNGSIKLQIPLVADIYANWKTCVKMLVKVCASHHEDAQPAITLLLDIKPAPTTDYHVNPNVNLAYTLDKAVSIKVGPFTVNLVSMTRDGLDKQVAKFQQTINTELAGKIPLREAAEKAWVAADKPILVSKENNLWLTSRLEGVYSAPLTTEGNSAILNLGFSGKFSALVGDPPAVPAPTPLPPLTLTAAPPGFILNVPLSLQFAELEKRLNAASPFSYDFKGNVITVNQMALSSTSDGKLSVGLQVNLTTAGKWFNKKGWIYLTGKPVYDQTRKRVVFQDLAYTSHTESVLLNQAAWATEPLVIAALKSRAYIEVGDYLSDAQTKVNAYVTSFAVKGVGNVSGHLDSLKIEDIIVQQQGVVVNANAVGAMALTIEGVSSN